MSWLFNARRYKLDFQTRFRNLENKFNAKVTNDTANEGEDLQTSTVGNIGKSYLKFCDTNLASLKTITSNSPPSMFSFEPDFDTCKLYVEFDTLGKEVSDYSGFKHPAKTVGIGRVHKGINYGFADSIEMILDGRSCYAEIVNHSDIRVSSITTGFSLFFRFLPFSLTESPGGFRQVVVCKKDIHDTDWWSFEIYSDGKAGFNMKKANVVKSIVTPPGVITATPYNLLTPSTPRFDVAVSYDHGGAGTLKLFINNVLYSNVSSTLPSGTQSPSTALNNNLMVGRWSDIAPPPSGQKYALRANSKLYHGVFQQLKFFQNKIVTDVEVSNHYNNKVTISAIPYGRVASAGTMIMEA